jgi:bisphosphoglycerate-dependent phosphoglycerate mutase
MSCMFPLMSLENSTSMPESNYRSVCVNNVMEDDSLQKIMGISVPYWLDHIRASMYTLTFSTC